MPKTLPKKLSKEWIVAEKKKIPEQELPLGLRAGNIKPMEGMAASKPPRYYVEDYAYIGYPLIRGQRIFVVADGGRVQYQDEKGIVPAPDPEISGTFYALYEEVGAFVLEGIFVCPDTNSIGKKSSAKAVKINEENGDTDNFVMVEIHIYRALYLKNDLRQLSEDYRNMVASTLAKLMHHPGIEVIQAMKNEKNKEALSDGPAIWFLRDAPYRPGLDEKRQPWVNIQQL
jgi:hypothetical protein